MQERAQTPSTVRAYRSTYNSMANFEQKIGKTFEENPIEMLCAYIENEKYVSVVSLNTRLPYIKAYLRCLPEGGEVEEYTPMSFDLSKAMRASFVESLEEMYQRCNAIYSPDKGDAVFPLVSFAWMGLSQTIALTLPESDVDLANRRIKVDAPLIFDVMPSSMIDILQRYQFADVAQKNNGQTKLPDKVGTFIYKMSFAGSFSAGKTVDVSTSTYFFAKVRETYNAAHALQTTTTYNNIIDSARYYKARQMELNGIDWNQTSNAKLLQSVFQTTRIEPGYLRHNYQMYKKAFGLK